ncbi:MULTISPECIES: DUF397 domain-containing protein [Actinoalloteichus]|nr:MULTISPECIES: DUF397 domain-containing protein [Actinoalloteichus]
MAGRRSTAGQWRKSSRSGAASGGGQCVEVALFGGDDLAIRDSKAPEAGMLSLTSVQSAAFLAGVKAGRFDVRS